MARLRELVADDGTVHLWFDAPGGQDMSRVGDAAGQALSAGGFTVSVEAAGEVVHVTGRPA